MKPLLSAITVLLFLMVTALCSASPTPTFEAAVSYATGDRPNAVAAGDFNGDGSVDLVVANVTGATLSYLAGNSNGTCPSGHHYFPRGCRPENIIS